MTARLHSRNLPCRTRPGRLGTQDRLCVRSVSCPGRFPLASALPSTTSAPGRQTRFVRRLPRYYDAVRLPSIVHHRRASLDFPMRSGHADVPDNRGISRFPCIVRPCMRRVCDRAGSVCLSRCRGSRCCLPPLSTTSAPGSDSLLSRLNGWPARTPVNASPPSLRTTAHDSGADVDRCSFIA